MDNIRKFNASMAMTIADVNTAEDTESIDKMMSMTLREIIAAFNQLPAMLLDIPTSELMDLLIARCNEEALGTFVANHPEFGKLSEEEEKLFCKQFESFLTAFGETMDD